MFTVADITAEGAGASTPVHCIAGCPYRCNPSRVLTRASRIPLACLARLAAWQSRSSRHSDFPLLPVPALWALGICQGCRTVRSLFFALQPLVKVRLTSLAHLVAFSVRARLFLDGGRIKQLAGAMDKLRHWTNEVRRHGGAVPCIPQ